MPLPLAVSCFSKIQIGFTFLVPAHPSSPGQRAVKQVCVCVCVVVHFFWLMNACFCFVRFSFFHTKPRDWLGERSPKWPILSLAGRKTTTQSISLWLACVCVRDLFAAAASGDCDARASKLSRCWWRSWTQHRSKSRLIDFVPWTNELRMVQQIAPTLPSRTFFSAVIPPYRRRRNRPQLIVVVAITLHNFTSPFCGKLGCVGGRNSSSDYPVCSSRAKRQDKHYWVLSSY